MRANGSLQIRIMILVSVGMLTVLASFGALSMIAVDQSVGRTLQERLNLAEATASHLDYVIKQNLDLLQGVSFGEGVDLQDADPEPERRALHNAYFHSIFGDGIYIVDVNGEILRREPQYGAFPSSLSAYPHIREALETGKPIVSDIYTVEDTGRPVVSMVIPVKNAQGQMVGLVGGDIDLTSSSLQKMIRPIGLGPSGYVEVVDSKGVVVAASQQAHVLRESDHSNRLATLIQQKQPKVSTCHDCHEASPQQGAMPTRDAEVMAFVPLQTASWGLTIREAEKEALEPARQIQQQFLLFGIPTFVISVLLGWGMAQSVIRPVTALTRTAEKIAWGNLSDRTPYLGEDEIGRLALAFEGMRLKLKEALENFQSLNKELESRVERRTEELRESQRQLLRRNQELSLLNARVISAQEEERKRIARELHDDTSQSLAALVVALETAAIAPFRSSDDVVKRIQGMKGLAVHAMDEIHNLVYDLRPSLLDDLGLIPAIEWYADTRLRSAGVKVRVEVGGDERRLEQQIETAMFRVVQEAITNIAKHANAQNVAISLEFGESSVAVAVEDDGDGFDVRQITVAAGPDDGFGLLGMRERISLLGGELLIRSELAGGTTIGIMVPVNRRGDRYAEDKSASSR